VTMTFNQFNFTDISDIHMAECFAYHTWST
jgi:hypothetical protein